MHDRLTFIQIKIQFKAQTFKKGIFNSENILKLRNIIKLYFSKMKHFYTLQTLTHQPQGDQA